MPWRQEHRGKVDILLFSHLFRLVGVAKESAANLMLKDRMFLGNPLTIDCHVQLQIRLMKGNQLPLIKQKKVQQQKLRKGKPKSKKNRTKTLNVDTLIVSEAAEEETHVTLFMNQKQITGKTVNSR